MSKDYDQTKRKEVANLKVGNDTVLYALGLNPIGPKRITVHDSTPVSKTGIFHKIAAHPDFISAKAKMNLGDPKDREEFCDLCVRIRKEIVDQMEP